MGREIEEIEGDLVEVTEVAKRNKPQEIGVIARQDGLKGLMEYGKQEGYKNPSAWARRQLSVRHLPIR